MSCLALTQDDRYIFFALNHESGSWKFELDGIMMLDLKEGQEPTEFIHADKLTRMLVLALSS